jgi:hypothetical protein
MQIQNGKSINVWRTFPAQIYIQKQEEEEEEEEEF